LAPVTSDGARAGRVDRLALHGMNRHAWKGYFDPGSWYHEGIAPGFEYDPSDALAATGLSQLERFDEMQRRRRKAVAPDRAEARHPPRAAPGNPTRARPAPPRGRSRPQGHLAASWAWLSERSESPSRWR
jgi:hypothetical protein